MKKWILFLILGVGSHCGFAQISSARLQASGLTCAMCARAVYKNLESLSFIEKIDTDLNGSAFLLDFKDQADVDLDAIRKKVEDAGFSVAGLSVNAVFSELKVGKDKHVRLGSYVFHFLGVKQDHVVNGEQTFRVVDKSFVSGKEQKKFQGMTTMECYRTGVASNCCMGEGIKASERIYHITL
jgi:copper chaperone CopZ